MTYTIQSAFTNLANGMAAYISENASTFAFDYGFRARAEQFKQRGNRIVLVQGDPTNGDGGQLVQPRQVGRWQGANTTTTPGGETVSTYETRPIVDWDRVMTISAWGVDDTAGVNRDERAQASAAESCLEIAVQAALWVVGPNIVWARTKWTVPQDNPRGLEILQSFVLQQPLFDLPFDRATPAFTLAKNPPE